MSKSFRLTQTLLLSTRSKRSFVPLSLTDIYPPNNPLIALLDNIYFFPLEWRKFILDACRIQQPSRTNIHLSSQVWDLVPEVIVNYGPQHHLHTYYMERETVLDALDAVTISPIACNILSYFVRAESTIFKEEFNSLRRINYDKELHASTNAQSILQRLNYEPLFDPECSGRLHPQLEGKLGNRLFTLFNNGLRKLKSDFSRTHVQPLLPAYNGKKNMSYQTQREYQRLTRVDSGQLNITSLDLLRYYRLTGHRVTGPMELRQVWFFNDLKPRVYFANGGDSYFESLYVQQIANRVCKFLPSTHPDHRFEVSRLGSLRNDEIMITYDYSAFTSSLSELKYFMFYLATALRGVPIDVYDPFTGVASQDLGELLHRYNNFANVNMMFSAERMDDKMSNPILSMNQAGALGIKGNIVFSTSLHGIALADASGTPDRDCCVGDDALTFIYILYITLFVSCVNNLGEINLTKFSITKPIDEDPCRRSAFKFIKRPLDLNSLSCPTLGTLEFFPDIASILHPDGDGFHTLPPGTDFKTRVESFVMQVSRYSLVIARSRHPEDIYDEDESMVIEVFRKCYTVLGLPIEGAKPGYKVLDPDGIMIELDLFIPPVDTDLLLEVGWLDVCYSKFGGQFITVVQTSNSMPPPLDHYLGQSFLTTSDFKEIRLLEMLGYIVSENIPIVVCFDEHYYKTLRLRLSQSEVEREPVLKQCTVVEECPHYYDLVQYLSPDIYGQDIVENVSIISSLLED